MFVCLHGPCSCGSRYVIFTYTCIFFFADVPHSFTYHFVKPFRLNTARSYSNLVGERQVLVVCGVHIQLDSTIGWELVRFPWPQQKRFTFIFQVWNLFSKSEYMRLIFFFNLFQLLTGSMTSPNLFKVCEDSLLGDFNRMFYPYSLFSEVRVKGACVSFFSNTLDLWIRPRRGCYTLWHISLEVSTCWDVNLLRADFQSGPAPKKKKEHFRGN